MDELPRKLSDGTEISYRLDLPTYDSILLDILWKNPRAKQRELKVLYEKRRSELDIVNKMRAEMTNKVYIDLGLENSIRKIRKFKEVQGTGIVSEDTSQDKHLLENLYQEAHFRLYNPGHNGNN